MPTDADAPPGRHDEAVGRYLGRKEASLLALNERIARLAIALELALDRPGVIERLIRQAVEPAAPAAPYGGPERRVARSGYGGPERRRTLLFEELRGLVVLRYEMERTFAAQLGADTTVGMLEHVSAVMTRTGFAPGADGMDLERLVRPD